MTHQEKVLEELRRRKNSGITSGLMIDMYNNTRLAAYIMRLRAKGFEIRTDLERTKCGKSKTARYFLVKEAS